MCCVVKNFTPTHTCRRTRHGNNYNYRREAAPPLWWMGALPGQVAACPCRDLDRDNRIHTLSPKLSPPLLPPPPEHTLKDSSPFGWLWSPSKRVREGMKGAVCGCTTMYPAGVRSCPPVPAPAPAPAAVNRETIPPLFGVRLVFPSPSFPQQQKKDSSPQTGVEVVTVFGQTECRDHLAADSDDTSIPVGTHAQRKKSTHTHTSTHIHTSTAGRDWGSVAPRAGEEETLPHGKL